MVCLLSLGVSRCGIDSKVELPTSVGVDLATPSTPHDDRTSMACATSVKGWITMHLSDVVVCLNGMHWRCRLTAGGVRQALHAELS